MSFNKNHSLVLGRCLFIASEFVSLDFSEVWISRQEFTSAHHTPAVLTQDSVGAKKQQSSDSRLLVMWVVRADRTGKMSASRSGSFDQSEARIGSLWSNQRGGNVRNNAGVKRLLALVPADVALLLVASSSSYKIILILSIWKWFKWVFRDREYLVRVEREKRVENVIYLVLKLGI